MRVLVCAKGECDNYQDPHSADSHHVATLVRDFIQAVHRLSNPLQPSLTISEFVDFLFSKRNSVFNEEHAIVYQDMDQPICHYWIDSSHNTSVRYNKFLVTCVALRVTDT